MSIEAKIPSRKPKINLIYAKSINGVIGNDGKMPWHVPEDMERFRKLTTNGAVVMGRKTWDSLPEYVKPLPSRHNFVLTNNYYWKARGAHVINGAESIKSLGDWTANDVWVIGGAQLYKLALPFADQVYETVIERHFDGDTSIPELNHFEWREKDLSNGISVCGLPYRFVRYERELGPDAIPE